jgi:hypothetical protein
MPPLLTNAAGSSFLCFITAIQGMQKIAMGKIILNKVCLYISGMVAIRQNNALILLIGYTGLHC